jgi:homocysteine S-methyltransferase
MVKVTERCYEATGHTTFMCDFSPPRSGGTETLEQSDIGADFIAVAYNPGRAVRVNSAMLAAEIKQHTGRDVSFTLATRDMNRVALQSLLLGAQLLGLENVVVVRGDPFSARDLALVKPVNDTGPSELIASIKKMNDGLDFRDSKLRQATDFCVGATIDLGRGFGAEAGLTVRKAEAGAEFFLTQPIFDPADAQRFYEAYSDRSGQPLGVPVFFGLQILEAEGVLFSTVPETIREELTKGRPGVDIALELFGDFQSAGLHNVYLVPPIRRGGARNYGPAREFLAAAEGV